MSKKQQRLEKKLRHMQTKRYAKEQKAKLKRLSDKIWKQSIREKFGNKCAVSGQTGLLHPHHILPKETFPEFRHSVDNGILLTPTFHKYGKFSFHKNPIWAAEWLKENYPELHRIALERSNNAYKSLAIEVLRMQTQNEKDLNTKVYI